jgi:hypothetical protein
VACPVSSGWAAELLISVANQATCAADISVLRPSEGAKKVHKGTKNLAQGRKGSQRKYNNWLVALLGAFAPWHGPVIFRPHLWMVYAFRLGKEPL